MFNPAFLSAAAHSSQRLLNSFLSLVSFLTPLYLYRLYGFLCTSSTPLIFSFRLSCSLHLYFCPGLFFHARLFIPRSFLRFSTHPPLPLSYLVSRWVFSRFSGDELLSRAQMRPEALILLQQWYKEQSPELTSHFRLEWSSIVEAFENHARGGNALPKQNNNGRQGFVCLLSSAHRCLQTGLTATLDQSESLSTDFQL